MLSINRQRYAALWGRQAVRDALSPPAVRLSDAEVVSFVRQTRGAIGYVSTRPRDGILHVVAKY
jgi:hypothetical protein